MSTNSELDAEDTCTRASCGSNRVDNIDLDMKYPTVECQNNREQHEEDCKKRMVAELRDKDLFTMPDSSCYGECPICCLPLSIDARKSMFMPCCSKSLCMGCHYANQMRENEAGLEHRCAFCREPLTETDDEADKKIMKRIKENNDPAAMRVLGNKHCREGDYETGLKYFTKAAELGNAGAHYNLSVMYREGHGVEKDKKKEVYHLEEAAIGGHAWARHNLGNAEWRNGRFERAKKHWIIAANLGLHESLKGLRVLYVDGHASKEEYADALRAHQASVDETKSEERKIAEEAIKNGSFNRSMSASLGN